MRNEGIMHPFTISHRRWDLATLREGREIGGGAVESRASTGKVELERIFGGECETNRPSRILVSRRYQAGTHLRRVRGF